LIPGGNSFSCAINATPEPIIIEWLKKVIDRIHFECFDRVLIVSSYEYYSGHALSANFGNHVEAAAAGHLNVEQYQVWILRENRFDGLRTASAFRDDFDVLHRAQHIPQTGSN
jgi:hypothetical protein